MRIITQLSTAFLMSLPLLGVAIYYFVEEDNAMGKIFTMATVFALLTLFVMIRSIYYLRHSATFNEIFFVFIVPLIPVVIVLMQVLLGVYNYNPDVMIVSEVPFVVKGVEYLFYINIIDFLLLPFYIFSNFLLLRTFIRYPFIRFKGTSEKGIPPKFFGFLMMIILPTIYIITSFFYLDNLFLMVFGIGYFYTSLLTIFV